MPGHGPVYLGYFRLLLTCVSVAMYVMHVVCSARLKRPVTLYRANKFIIRTWSGELSGPMYRYNLTDE